MKLQRPVKVTVIDDRERVFTEECPFYGPQGRCNVNETSDPRCVGSDHEDCLLHQYDRFVVERREP